jgi:hypothetical protein
MPETIVDLGKKVKAKYPGTYDDLDDAEVGRKVKTKFPGDYEDFTDEVAAATATEEPLSAGGVLGAMANQAGRTLGAAWENTNPFPGLAALMMHPINTATGAFKATSDAVGRTRESLGKGNFRDAATSALGTIPLIGPGIEQAVGEARQGQIPEALGHAAGMLAPLGVSKAMKGAAASRIPGALKTSATESYSRAFAPTKEKFKTMTAKVVEGAPGTPGMIERGVTAMSRKGLQSKITDMVDKVGEQIDVEQAKIPEGTLKIPAKTITDAIDNNLRDEFMIDTAKGKVLASPDAEQALKVGGKLKMLLAQASEVDPAGKGRVIDYQILRRFKQNWDRSIAGAGGFANKTFENNAKMGAYQEAAGAARAILNAETPDIAALNREFHFWKQAPTVDRTKAQSQPMGQQIATAAGTAAGLATGGIGKALEYGYVLRNLRKLTTSTAWNTVSAVAKDRLANALASADPKIANGLILSMMGTQATVPAEVLNPAPIPPP